jgi:hypothetical protein
VENIVLFYHVLCSIHFPAYQFSVSHKIVWYSCFKLDRIGSTWPQAAPPIYLVWMQVFLFVSS